MEISTEFWIGIALAIPLAIVSSLVTAPVQRVIDRRSVRARHRHLNQLEQDLERAKIFAADRSALNSELLEALVRIGLYGAVAGAIAGMFFFTGQMVGFNFIFAAGQFAGLVGALLIIQVASGAIKDVARSRNLAELEKEVATLRGRSQDKPGS